MPEALDEGWYTDPYQRHEARWFSQGRATKLVRDQGVEAYDEPPEGPPEGVAEKIVIDPPAGLGPSDLLRADDAEHEQFDEGEEAGAALDAFDQSGGSIPALHEPDPSAHHRPR
jgi:hypothetical protein